MRGLPILVILAALLAGCASDPSPSPSPSPSPTPGGIWAGYVEVTLEASRTSIRPGEPVTFTLTAKNHREGSIWTNPQFACSGTWDVRVHDPSGAAVRVDDRDAMGCPSGGPLETEVGPGESANATYTWDGYLRPSLGQTADPPPGDYRIVGSVGHANDSREVPSEGLDVRSASVIVRVA